MTPTERLELLAVAKAGRCALQLASECTEENATAVLRGAIRSFVAALVSLDRDSARELLREMEVQYLLPAKNENGLYLAVVNDAQVLSA